MKFDYDGSGETVSMTNVAKHITDYVCRVSVLPLNESNVLASDEAYSVVLVIPFGCKEIAEICMKRILNEEVKR